MEYHSATQKEGSVGYSMDKPQNQEAWWNILCDSAMSSKLAIET